jgi:RNA-directed DNA polymerase
VRASAAPKHRQGEKRCGGPAGVGEGGRHAEGSPGTWEASRLRSKIRVGAPVTKPQAVGVASHAARSEEGVQERYLSARDNRSAEGRAGRSRSARVGPVKQGNADPSGPCGGKAGAGSTDPLEGKMEGTSKPTTVSTKLQRIAELARQMPTAALTTLGHHIDVEWLKEAFQRTRQDGAAGVDGQTAAEYAARLEENLTDLLERVRTQRYVAPPVRRVHIPKEGGTRPIGIPILEDKVLQRAVAMVLEAVYEQEFLDCSYGFLPGRSAHQALDAFWQQMMAMGGGWVLEVDIRSFFDALDHSHLRHLIERRIRDGRLLRLIGKWLNAGVLEDGELWYPETGTPQGGVISPVLANVYLHEVLDVWFEREVKPRLGGQAFLIRYADDVVLGFACEADARRVLEVLPKRLSKYGLTLHPEKTRLVRFEGPRDKDGPGPGTFDLLGFTHYWSKSRKGKWVIKRKTAAKRLRRTLTRVAEWCRTHRHDRMKEQHRALARKVQGHYAYYGITGNARCLAAFWHSVERIWQRWLSRRSQRARIRWDRFKELLRVFPLPGPRVVHSIYRVANP